MKKNKLILSAVFSIFLAFSAVMFAQVPIANFSISPNPVCSGAVVQITNMSSGATSWSYTLNPGFGFFLPPTISTVQNPTITYNYNNFGNNTYTISLIASNASGNSIVVTKTITVLAGPNANINPANQNSCLGSNPSTINVNSGGGGGGGGGGNAVYNYSWSTGASTQSITVSPSVTTIYTCVITATNGCSITRTSTITIVQASIAISSVPANICPGTTSTLTAYGSGNGPYTYTWSNAANTQNISTNVAGVYNVTVTNSSNCSAVQSYSLGTSNTLNLTTSSNPSTLCIGNGTNLAIATLSCVGASSYTWSTGSTALTTTVAPTIPTTYTVYGAIGTCTGISTYFLNISISPTITSASTSNSLCVGSTATLSANGASSYTWTTGFNNTLVGTGAVITVTPGGTTLYTVRGNNPGCPTRTSTLNITTLPSPVVNISSSNSLVCAGENLVLIASGANTYLWSNGANTAIIIVTPTTNTTYSVTGTGTNSCSRTSQITQNVNPCTSILKNTILSQAIQIFPNPSKGTFNIKSDNLCQIRIINQLGQTVKTLSLNENNQFTGLVSELSKGIYFIISNDQSSKQKIVIQD